MELQSATRYVAVLEAVPDDEEKILADMGLIKADAVAPTLQEAIQYPSLNIRGMSSGWVGKESPHHYSSDCHCRDRYSPGKGIGLPVSARACKIAY